MKERKKVTEDDRNSDFDHPVRIARRGVADNEATCNPRLGVAGPN